MKSKIKLIVLVAIIFAIISIATAENAEAEECCPVDIPSAIITIEAGTVPGSNGNYFDVQLSNVPAGYDISNGTWTGWCADSEVFITPETLYDTNVYCSESSSMPGYTNDDEQWDKVNYVINRYRNGAYDSQLNSTSKADWQEVQAAIWNLTDANPNYQGYFTTASQYIIDDAHANGTGFCPGDNDIAIVVIDPYETPDDRKQLIFIEVGAMIDIEKSTNGEDADNKTGPLVLNGNNVEWTYNVTNTGYYNLTDVSVTDDKLGHIGTISLLQAGQSQEFTVNGIANPGQYGNNATVVGTPPSGPNVSDSDPSHYFGVNATIGDFLWDDTANNNGIQEPGESGIAGVNVSLYNFSDDSLLQTTKTNESGYYNFSVTAGQYYIKFDLLNGYLFSPENQGTDNEHDSDVDPSTAKTGKIDVQTTDFNMSFDAGMFKAIPGIDIEKSTNGEDADNETGPYIRLNYEVSWVYNVTNTGNVNLTSIDVTDDELGLIGTIPLLQPGQSHVLTENATASLGQYENTATAVGVPPIGPNVTDSDMSHYFGHDSQPGFDVPTANPLLIIGMLGLAGAMVLRREQE
ncbi:SdrD B-like domain-containing protein [Methanohalophilus mahii]|uniref:Cna B domain protein n=1 Tax=Methanohalophilus mahii (strain ATCC 35705 / DSM 5219 / SLP) TaxID=547558 RepID=D5E8S8_METMS|nr:SdrD B-like domain-containing protein [Methanohalophilus mahii]ADE35587.1 Cna B domain protein [Methanohalophilus mahii DSM 5219]